MASRAVTSPTANGSLIQRRELLTLLAYAQTGSHKAAAYRLGVSESTSRQRISRLAGRIGAANAAQAVWRLRRQLEAENRGDGIDVRSKRERTFGRPIGRPQSRP